MEKKPHEEYQVTELRPVDPKPDRLYLKLLKWSHINRISKTVWLSTYFKLIMSFNRVRNVRNL